MSYFPAREDFQKFTPVMQQYLNARQSMRDEGMLDKSILFFRMGDFYETFFADAELAARELEITLTGRPESNYPGGRLPMAGVPAKSMETYAGRLLERGYKICIAEQMADPSTCKGLVPREITKTLTPGTISDLNFLHSYKNNFIAALYTNQSASKKKFPGDHTKAEIGFAYADVSTGEFYFTQLNEEQLYQELARLDPAELVIPSRKAKVQEGEIEARNELLFEGALDKYLTSNLDKSKFKEELAEEGLKKLFNVASLDGYGAKDYPCGVQAAGGLLEYLKETQKDNISNFDLLKSYRVSEFMMLDANSRKNLELVESSQGTYDASLLWALDRTSSNLGKRRLRSWLEQPLFSASLIQSRQESVTELINDSENRLEISALLDRVYDIERLANRLANLSISPRELASLKESLLIVPQLSSLLSSAKSKYLAKFQNIPDDVFEFTSAVEAAIAEDPPITITEGNVIAMGYNEELDEYISLVTDSKTWCSNYETGEREKTGIKNLKVAFNKVHGYFLEITKGNLSLVPEEYHCKQTMVNSSRFITPELKEFEEKLTNAESRRNALEHKLYTELKRTLATKAGVIKELASDIANLDALLSLAKIAIEQNYTQPKIVDDQDLSIKDGRHPVVEQKLPLGEFVANDLHMGDPNSRDDNAHTIILTGPNMAGKSTYMRQNALIILLAHVGSYVPASEAKIPLVDRIFTRVGASDDLSSGQSTFMVEMNETALILNGMTERSFIILDEVGRGTSTFDGLSIAWAVVEYIVKSKNPFTIFATHYHELADLEKLYTDIANYQMSVTETKSANGKTTIEFLHKVSTGSADKSYGIEVARLAGLPKAVLTRAKTINSQLQVRENKLLDKRKANANLKNAITEDGNIDINRLPLFEGDCY